LNAIIGYSEMRQEEAQELCHREFIPDLQRIHAAGKHLLALINDILDLSKIEAGKMTLYLEDFNLRRLTEEIVTTVQPLIAKNSNRLIFDCLPEIGVQHAEMKKVKQINFNFLLNSIMFIYIGITI